jgi:ABC-type iron transport system FetAB ATPase subunit
LPNLHLQQIAIRHVGPVDLTIAAGECVCIQGASGTGKTLLLRALADLDAHPGEARLDGVACSSLPAPTWRRAVALVVAESQWWCELVRDHVDQGVNPLWMERLGLPAAAMDWALARCSTGERQRLALLRTLMQAPAALLLDEPTGNLDQDSTLRVEALLDEYRQQRQAALLWVSHDSAQIERVAQRSYLLENGQLQVRR